jgi:D-3-phosphoglycerate dehydrogenase
MNIVFAEPIGISEQEKLRFSTEMKALGHAVEFFNSPIESQAELLTRISNAEITVISNYPVEVRTIELCKKLKMISVAFTGVDHLPLDYCKLRKITICNAAGYSTSAVAELAIAMSINVLRRIVPLHDATISGKTRNGFLGGELNGKVFGIVGLGAIGQRVAELASAFGCKVIAHSRTAKAIKNVEMVSLHTLFNTADIISLHIPSNPQTIGLVNAELIELMKANAILVNTARGSVVDYAALAQALKSNSIGGAAVDIYEYEPPIQPNHPLLSAPNVVLLPHIAYATTEAIDRRTEIVLKNIRDWINGCPQNQVVS